MKFSFEISTDAVGYICAVVAILGVVGSVLYYNVAVIGK